MSRNAAAAEPVDNRRPDGKFGPGNRANPGGRPRKIAELSQAVRDTLDPRDLAALWLSVAQDENAKMGDRLEASRLLADRGWGKAVDLKPHDEEDPLGLNDARDRLVGKLAVVARIDDRTGESDVPAKPARAGGTTRRPRRGTAPDNVGAVGEAEPTSP